MVTAITQAKDLKSMNLEDLIGSLRAHEVVFQGDKLVKKVKTLALKASQQTSSVAEDDVQEPQEIEEVHEEEAEDELTLISKRTQRMMRRNQIRKKFPNTNNNTKLKLTKAKSLVLDATKHDTTKVNVLTLRKCKENLPSKRRQ